MDKSDLALVLVIVSILVFGGMDYWLYKEVKKLGGGSLFGAAPLDEIGANAGTGVESAIITSVAVDFFEEVGKLVALDANSIKISVSNNEKSFSISAETKYLNKKVEEGTLTYYPADKAADLNLKPGDEVAVGHKSGSSSALSIKLN